MSELQLFNFQDNQVRVVEIDSNPWFVLSDVLNAIKSTTTVTAVKNSIIENLGEEFVSNQPLETDGGIQDFIVTSEAGITFIVSRSKTDLGKLMNKWIHVEVLPSIRKTGAYISDTIVPNQIELLLTELIDKVNKLEEDKSHLIHLQAENDQLNKVYEEYPGLKEAITYLKNNIEDNSDSFSLKDYLETKSKLMLDRGQRIQIGQLVGSWTKIATNCSLTKIAGSTYYQNKHIKLIDLAIRYVCEI